MIFNNEIDNYLFQIRLRMNEYFAKTYGPQIIRGPFQGASLCGFPRWNRTDQISMLLGQYELEIQKFVHHAFQNANIFIDIGCGDGYYLAAASRYPNIRGIYGFDEANVAKVNSQEVLDINALVGTIGHTARLQDLELILSDERLSCHQRPFVMVDIEGAEFELLSKNIEFLQNCILIIETHDFSEAQADFLELKARLTAWFEIEVVEPGARNPFDFHQLNCFDTNMKWLAMSEGRTLGNKWIVCSPRDLAAN